MSSEPRFTVLPWQRMPRRLLNALDEAIPPLRIDDDVDDQDHNPDKPRVSKESPTRTAVD